MASRWTDVYRSPRVVHASPAASLLFYISLEVAKPDLNLRSSSMWPKPSSSLSEWRQLQGYWCHGEKNVFLSLPELAERLRLIHTQRLF